MPYNVGMISFVETKLFTRLVEQYLTDEEYSLLQRKLIDDPEAGSVIPGSGGIRKMRWGMAGAVSVVVYASSTFYAHAKVRCGC